MYRASNISGNVLITKDTTATMSGPVSLGHHLATLRTEFPDFSPFLDLAVFPLDHLIIPRKTAYSLVLLFLLKKKQ